MTSNIGSGGPGNFTFQSGPFGARGRVTACLLGIALSITMSSCNNDGVDPIPTGSTPTSVTPTRPAWEAKYSQDEIDAFRAAEDSVEVFEARVGPIYAEGRATPAARELFQDNLISWQAVWARLQADEKRGIAVARQPKVLSSEPKSIELVKAGEAAVVIRRCTDQSDLGATLNGKPLQEAFDDPVIQEVDTYLAKDGRWRIGTFKTLEETCAG